MRTSLIVSLLSVVLVIDSSCAVEGGIHWDTGATGDMNNNKDGDGGGTAADGGTGGTTKGGGNPQDSGASRDTGVVKDTGVIKGVGSPCTSSKDCPTAMGTFMVCKTQDTDGTKWLQGYCTMTCDTKNPNCPPNSICVDHLCLQGCASDTDCRAGYACHSSTCYPKTKSCKKSCSGCCDAKGNCLSGTTNNACGSPSGGHVCVKCGPVEKCGKIGPMGFRLCECKNDCTDGCCDPVSGKCLPGTSNTGCSENNHACYDCIKKGESCTYKFGSYSCY